MVQESKSRKLDQYIVRFPDGMRDRLKDQAAENNRSLNAEIIARLEDFQQMAERTYGLQLENNRLQTENDLSKERIRQLEAEVERLTTANRGLELHKADLRNRLKSAQDDEGPVFNIVLDAKGRPLGWPEIAAHIYRTAKAAGLEAVTFRAAIFNAEKAEDDMGREFVRLVRWYQEQTRKHKDEIRSDS
jgi:predicted nuclease with TOPRIM domain